MPKQLTPNLIRMTRLRFVNLYLVREDDGFTLVDTGIAGATDAAIGAAARADGEIRRIALTHGHGDHVGSLDVLHERLGSGVEVLMPALDAEIHAGEAFTDKKPPGGWPNLRTSPDTRLTGGARVGSLEVIDTPGHTPGHVSFLDTRDGTVIAGDVFHSIGGLVVSSHFAVPFPLPYMATWDRAKDLDSARRLRERDPSLLAVGHGPAIRSPAAAMDRAIARAEKAARG